jgi:hypothetical protein
MCKHKVNTCSFPHSSCFSPFLALRNIYLLKTAFIF